MADDPLRNARRQRIIRTIVVLCAFGALFYLARMGLHAARARQERIARASVHKCLFGRPFDPGERPAGRLHRIALFNPPKDWPSRCDRYLTDLAETRDDLEESWSGGWSPGHVDVDDIEGRPWDFDAFFEMGAPRPDVEAPPEVIAAPTAAYVADEKTPGIAGDLIGASFDPVPARGVRFLMAGTRLCETSVALDGWKCTSVLPKGRPVLLPTAEGGPPLVTPNRSTWMPSPDPVERLDTHAELCAEPTRACTVFGQSDGTVLSVYRLPLRNGEAFEYEAVRNRDGLSSRRPLGLELPAAVSPTIVGDRIVWIDRGHLVSRQITLGEPPLGPLQDWGAVPNLEIRACAVGSGYALWGVGMQGGFVAFPNRPAATFALPATEGRLTDEGASTSCALDGVTFAEVLARHRTRTDFDHTGFQVRGVRCTADKGCAAPEIIDVDEMLRDSGDADRPDGIRDDVRAVGHDGKLLVLWRSAKHGIRFRIGSAADIGKQPDFVAYDDRIGDGDPFAMSRIQETFRVLGRWEASVLMVETVDVPGRVKLFRIAPNGPVTTIAEQ